MGPGEANTSPRALPPARRLADPPEPLSRDGGHSRAVSQCLDAQPPTVLPGRGEDGSRAVPPALPAPLLRADGPPQPAPKHLQSWRLHSLCTKVLLFLSVLMPENTFSRNLCCCWFGPSISVRDPEMSCAASSPRQPRTVPAPFGLHFSQPSSPILHPSHQPRCLELPTRFPLDRPCLSRVTQSGYTLQPNAHPCSVPALQPGAASPAASPLLDAATNDHDRCCAKPLLRPKTFAQSARGLLAPAEGCVSRTASGTALTQQTTARSRLP